MFFCMVLIAETMVWPNFFLMNVFFALKGSKLFIIIDNLYFNDSKQIFDAVHEFLIKTKRFQHNS